MKAIYVVVFIVAATLSGCRDAGDTTVKPRNNKPFVTPEVGDSRPKLIAFGDSLTAGFGLAEDESYPFLLQKKLDSDGLKFQVINAGVSGDTTLGGLERVDWVLDEENVSVMILELGANDLLRGIPVAQMRFNLEAIIKKAQAKGVIVLLCGMLAPDTMGKQYQEEFIAVYPDLAKKYGLKFLPFILEGVALNPKLNQADGIHPNAEGEKIMTENVYRALKPMLLEEVSSETAK
ncbi:MAG: arylesterase [Pyrinomonadaceae bacterium]